MGKALVGVTQRERARTVIDGAWAKVIQIERQKQGEPRPRTIKKRPAAQSASELDVTNLAQNKFVDYGQNLNRFSTYENIRTLTGKSEIYSFHRDRTLLKREHFRLLGHGAQNCIRSAPTAEARPEARSTAEDQNES